VDVALHAYQQVIIDLPRQIDALTSTVLERADNVVIVMQESLASIRDAKRLLRIVQRDLAVLDTRIRIIVNRHQDKSDISLADLRESLKVPSFLLVPNDFKRVMHAINTGVSLLESEKHAAVTKAILKIAKELSGEAQTPPSGVLQKALSYLLPVN
jgi:pilus assembly protein CpaE